MRPVSGPSGPRPRARSDSRARSVRREGGGRPIAALPCLLLLSLLLCPQPAEAQWPTTDWKVYCYNPPLQEWVAPDGSGDRQAHADYGNTIAAYEAGGSCDDSDPATATGRVRESLRQISSWLEGQGFPPPNVPLVDGRFQAVFVPPDARRACYRGQCADNRSFYAYMGSATPAQNRTQPNVLLVRTEPLEHAHELFHAVQHAFDSFQGAEVANWVKEGTAEAVGRTWSRVSAHAGLSPRDFSEPLHRPAPPIGAYDDEAFWRAVAREYTDGETYGFLARLFEEDLAGDELAAVYRTFRSEFASGDGLADVYPRVLARHFDEDRFYGELTEVDVSFPDTLEREDAAADVSANAYRVRAEVPEGKHGELIIRVPVEEDEEYLHLVVDDRRFDQGGETVRRNQFTTTLAAGEHEFLARLADVPGDVSDVDSSEDPAPIEFVLNEIGQHRYFARVTGELGSAAPGADCSPEGELLSKGPLDWPRREAEFMAALEADADLATHVVSESMGWPIPREQLRELLVSASQAPFATGDAGTDCRTRRPHHGRQESDVLDLSDVTDAWSGETVRQGVRFDHRATAERHSLSGSLAARARARMLDEEEGAETFAVHFSGETEGRCGDAEDTRRGVLGCGGDAIGLHVWGWVLETAEPTKVRVTLRADARDRATATAAFIPAVLLDDRVPMGVPTSPPGSAEPLMVVASEAMSAEAGGLRERLDQELAEMAPEQRAQLEAMMGDVEEAMESMAGQMDQMRDGTVDAYVSLPGPPPDLDAVTYYLMTVVSFELDSSNRDASGESGHSPGAFRARASASVVSRVEKVEGEGGGAPPELPGLEDVEALLGAGR